MSIDNINISNHGIDNQRGLDKAQETQAKEGPVRQEGTPTPARDDSVALSSTAREIGRLSQLAGETPDRDARITQIREAIQNGTYNVSGEDIANSIIEAHKK